MTLELPNDLAQPLALDPLGDQHRLEQAGIVGQGIGLHAHHAVNHSLSQLANVLTAVRGQLVAVGTVNLGGS